MAATTASPHHSRSRGPYKGPAPHPPDTGPPTPQARQLPSSSLLSGRALSQIQNANAVKCELDGDECLSLGDMLAAFQTAINEEQAWALCHQSVKLFLHHFRPPPSAATSSSGASLSSSSGANTNVHNRQASSSSTSQPSSSSSSTIATTSSASSSSTANVNSSISKSNSEVFVISEPGQLFVHRDGDIHAKSLSTSSASSDMNGKCIIAFSFDFSKPLFLILLSLIYLPVLYPYIFQCSVFHFSFFEDQF